MEPGKPYDCGCRGLEMDINRHSDSSGGASESYFQVNHEQGGDGPDPGFLSRTAAVVPRAEDHHDPIFVMLDIKSKEGSVEAFPDEIDNYLGTMVRCGR